MMYGALQGSNAGLRRWMARIASPALSAVVVPGPEIADVLGLDLEQAGLSRAPNPRRANVLVVVGALPAAMANAAAVLWAQMPRPRMILAVGDAENSPLPEADVRVPEYVQAELEQGVVRLRENFVSHAFRADVHAFEPTPLREDNEQDTQGDEQQNDQEGHEGHQEHGKHDHEGHGHEHGDMDFMSMVEMTKDLPRSSDGLPMEWLQEVPFGPCFPGLPGGLVLTLTLDGGTVAEACARSAVIGHFRPARLPMSAGGFAGWLATLDPLAADAYRVLAVTALERAAGIEADDPMRRVRAWRLERQRAASHLGWLSNFAITLGLSWLRQRASFLHRALIGNDIGELSDLLAGFRTLRQRVDRTPLLQSRLRGIGAMAADTTCLGPLARALGRAEDARCTDDTYRGIGFEPVVAQSGDALARWQVRLAEIEQSLALMQQLESGETAVPEGPSTASGSGAAEVETPRGMARLRVTLDQGQVQSMELQTPSTAHLHLVPALGAQQELGDALLAIGSLDLSPWEVLP